MEEDIKILEGECDCIYFENGKCQYNNGKSKCDKGQAIEKLLKQYKDLKRANSDLQGEQEQLYDKLDKLEEENAMLKKANNIAEDVTVEDITQVVNKSLEDFKREFIPISVIQNKLDELDKITSSSRGEEFLIFDAKQDVLQELLDLRSDT